MRTQAAFSLAVLAFVFGASCVNAAEGRWSERSPAHLDASRRAAYAAENSDSSAAAPKSSLPPPKAHGKSIAASGATPRRSASADSSIRNANVTIYDASSTLLSDRDEDGYHHEFRIRFDADTTADDALVYARLYLRRLGDPEWLLYHTTDEFWIGGQTADDEYYVSTALDDGFPTDDYDVLIDLYESGYSGIVATLGPNESAALGLLPLEEVGLDAPIEITGYALGGVATTLLIDDDGDEHFSRFRIRFDPDADVDGRIAYARIWVRPEGGDWFEEHVTEDFVVDANDDADAYTLTADWLEGYPTAYYDVQIDMYDASTNLLAATAGSERAALARVPLEDASRDVRPNPPTNGGTPGDSHSREHGGGALSFGWLLLLLAISGARVQRRRTDKTIS